MSEIKIGSEVRLKSDSQKMTVEDIQDGLAYCVFRRGGQKVQERYPLDVLVAAEPVEPPTIISPKKYDWVGPK